MSNANHIVRLFLGKYGDWIGGKSLSACPTSFEFIQYVPILFVYKYLGTSDQKTNR